MAVRRGDAISRRGRPPGGAVRGGVGGDPDNWAETLRTLLEPVEWEEDWHFPSETPVEVSGPHRLVLCVQGDAPYDDVGVCIVEVAALAGSGYEGRAPETDRPAEWDERDSP